MVYRTEGHEMFRNLMGRMQHDIVHTVYHASLMVDRKQAPAARPSPMARVLPQRREAVAAGARKIGRNDPCHCGSGKKYKKCHGANNQ